jgi:cell division protein FtsA
MKRIRIAAIDVGTTKVCTIMADTDGTSLPRILGVGVAPCGGLHKGLVVNFNEAKQSIRESIRKAEETAGYRLESAYVGVTGAHISSANNRGAIVITRNDRKVSSKDLQRVLQVARNVKIPGDRKLLHVIPRTYIVDGEQGVRNPVGMHGFRVDIEAHIISAAVTAVQNLTKCIRGVGVEIDELVAESLASAEAVLTEEEKQNGVLLADIGGGTTDLAVFKDNSIYYTSVLPVGGHLISRDISVGLNIPLDLAEGIKRRYGNAMPIHDRGETDRTMTEDGHTISYSTFCEIIRIRVEELLRLILVELPRSEYTKLIPAGMVLTGGTANLPGVAELGCEVTRLPVRVGTPIRLPGVADIFSDPGYATSVGLLLWKAKNKDTQGWEVEGGLRRFISRSLPGLWLKSYGGTQKEGKWQK